MKRFESTAAPYKVVWMVVPNKSTVYLQQNHADAFRAEFNPQNIGPDLFALAEENRFKMMDLFPANETHVSTRGLHSFRAAYAGGCAPGDAHPGCQITMSSNPT